MIIPLEIPKEFEKDLDPGSHDNIVRGLRRCVLDIRANLERPDIVKMAGNYEAETLEMLANAFEKVIGLEKEPPSETEKQGEPKKVALRLVRRTGEIRNADVKPSVQDLMSSLLVQQAYDKEHPEEAAAAAAERHERMAARAKTVSEPEPTEKQVAFAKKIAERLDVDLPEEYTRTAYSEFIGEWKDCIGYDRDER